MQICRWWYKIHFSLSIQVKGTVSRDEYFFEVLKNQSSTFCGCADGFKFVLHLHCQKITFKFLLASMKTLTNSGDFTGSRTSLRKLSLDFIVWYRSPSQWHVSLLWRLLKEDGDWGTSIQPLKKLPANHLHVIFKINPLKFFRIFYHHLQLTEQFTESHAASWMLQQTFTFWRGFQ